MFQTAKSFKFLKGKFGSQGNDYQSFHVEWYDTYHWLHYNTPSASDYAFCHVCMVAEFEKKFQTRKGRQSIEISCRRSTLTKYVLMKIQLVYHYNDD